MLIFDDMKAEEPRKVSHAQKCDDMQQALLDTVMIAWDAFKLHNNNFGPDDNSSDFCEGVESVEVGLDKLFDLSQCSKHEKKTTSLFEHMN